MTPERILELEMTDAGLNREEISQGWHFCPEFAYLLVGPGMIEVDMSKDSCDGCKFASNTEEHKRWYIENEDLLDDIKGTDWDVAPPF